MPRTLALVLVALAVAATLWVLGMFGGGPGVIAPAALGTPPAPAPARAESATTAPAADAAATPQRVAVAPDTTGIALLGTVQDDAGVAIAGAVVACTPAFAGSFAGADAADVPDFDMTSMLEHLRAAQRQQVEGTTDATGRFRLVPRGTSTTVDVRVRARGHLVLERQAQRPTTGDVDLGALRLERGALVSGRVVDRQGQPVQGAQVAQVTKVEAQYTDLGAGMGGGMDDLEFPGTAELERLRNGDNGVSDAAGRFALDHVEPGELSLRARHPDHPSTRVRDLAVVAGKSLTDVTIVLEAGGAISGEVVDAAAGIKGLCVLCSEKPADNAAAQGFMSVLGGDVGDFLADAGMNFGARNVEVGDDRRFTLRGLHQGRTYRVWASQTGRGFTGSSPCSERLELPAGSTGVQLHFDAGVSVTCRVVDAADAPIERLLVQDQLQGGGGLGDMMSAFAPGRQTVRSYPEGRVTIANLRSKKTQTLSLSIEALGFGRLDRTGIALPATGTLDLGTLQLEAAPVVHVTVTAKATGKPVAGAAVHLRGVAAPDASTPAYAVMNAGRDGMRAGKTDGKGRCDLNADDADEVVIAVSSKEHAPYASDAIAVPRGGCEHHAELMAGGTVEIDVVEVGGSPVVGIAVEHAGDGVAMVEHKTDAKGHVAFARLPAGSHEFRIGAASANPIEASMRSFQRGREGEDRAAAGWHAVELEAEGKASLTLTRNPTATLRGVVRENGAALAGARVAFVAGPATGDAAEDSPQQAMLAAMGDFAGGSSHTAKTNDDGSYELKDLPVGAHRLRISHKERSMPTTTAIALAAGGNTVDVDLEMTTVRGTVRDPAGSPVAGAKITVRAAPAAGADADAGLDAMETMMPGLNVGGGRVVKSGDDGGYELRGLQSGIRLQVRATAKGFAPATSAAIEVERGATKTAVDLQLGAAGRVKVTSANAPAFSAVTATFVPADGTEHAAVAPVMQLLKKGVATLDGLTPGRWKIEIAGPEMQDREPKVVDVVAGETVTVDF